MNVHSLVCASSKVRYTTRDGLIGAAAMVLATFVLVTIGIAARRNGFLIAGDMLKSLAFPASMTLSMPFWIMKGQPWKAQAVIVGGTTVLLLVIGYISTLI